MVKSLSDINKKKLAILIVLFVVFVMIVILSLKEKGPENFSIETEINNSEENNIENIIVKKDNEYREMCVVNKDKISVVFTLYDVKFSDDLTSCMKIYRNEKTSSYSGDYIIKINDEPAERYDEVVPYSFINSSNKDRIAFIIKNGDKKHVVLDGVLDSEGYDDIWGVNFSSDGLHFVYAAQNTTEEGERNCVIVYDGEKYGIDKKYSEITDLNFSDDNKSFSYIGNWQDGNSENNLIGEETGINFLPDHFYSLDPNYVANAVYEKDGLRIEFNEIVGKKYSYIDLRSLVFSPDNKHLAYVVKNTKEDKEGEYSVVSDGKEGPLFSDYKIFNIWSNPIDNIIYSNDGSHMAYVVRSNTGCNENYSVILDNYTVYNSEKTKDGNCKIYNCDSCELATDLSFSDDGKYFAFVSPNKDSYGIIKLSSNSEDQIATMFKIDFNKIVGEETAWIKNILIDSKENTVSFNIITKSGKTFFAKEYITKKIFKIY